MWGFIIVNKIHKITKSHEISFEITIFPADKTVCSDRAMGRCEVWKFTIVNQNYSPSHSKQHFSKQTKPCVQSGQWVWSGGIPSNPIQASQNLGPQSLESMFQLIAITITTTPLESQSQLFQQTRAGPGSGCQVWGFPPIQSKQLSSFLYTHRECRVCFPSLRQWKWKWKWKCVFAGVWISSSLSQ